MMSTTDIATDRGPALLDVVGLLTEKPQFGVRRGGVGTLVAVMAGEGWPSTTALHGSKTWVPGPSPGMTDCMYPTRFRYARPAIS